MEVSAKRYLVSGRVQGVGYRNFVQQVAVRLRIAGYVRNLDDGRVEVYAIAQADKHAGLAGYLRRGPRWADVRGVEEFEAAMLQYEGFRVTH